MRQIIQSSERAVAVHDVSCALEEVECETYLAYLADAPQEVARLLRLYAERMKENEADAQT